MSKRAYFQPEMEVMTCLTDQTLLAGSITVSTDDVDEIDDGSTILNAPGMPDPFNGEFPFSLIQ